MDGKQQWEAALEALRLLRKSDLQELIALVRPPSPVLHAFQCVAILLGVNDVSWQSIMRMTQRDCGKFLASLLEFDIAGVMPEQAAAVNDILQQNFSASSRGVYDESKLAEMSPSAAAALKWVRAVMACYLEGVRLQRKRRSSGSPAPDYSTEKAGNQ